MPFRSRAQARFLYKFHPDVAEEFAKKTPSLKALPQHRQKDGKYDRRRPVMPKT